MKFLTLTVAVVTCVEAFLSDDNGVNDQSEKQKRFNYDGQGVDGEKACKLTPKMKAMLVRIHNDIRQKIASGNVPGFGRAACMNKLDWDDRVANIAQKHANGRYFDHDHSNNRYFMDGHIQASMGQNLGLAEVERTPNFVKTIWEMFAHEIKKLKMANVVDPFVFGTSYGHASQILWATTAHIGCGSSFIRQCDSCSFDSSSIRDICLLTCNYNPPGNYDKEDTPMYVVTKGQAGDKCHKRATGPYDALCETPNYLVDPSPAGRCTP